MSIKNNISVWWRNIFRRRRLSLFSIRDNNELWHTHISVANILMAIVSTVLLLFVLVLTLVGYTPLLELMPGYRSETLAMRQSVISNLVRIDSMERVVNEVMLYTDNIALIMEGRTPFIKESLSIDSVTLTKNLVLPSQMDSLLRQQMEGDGRYSVRLASYATNSSMVAPAEGIITRGFDVEQEQYGVDVSAIVGGRVVAVQRGVVLMSLWSPESEYTVQILHPDNMISIYENLQNVIVQRGERVNAGSVIGYNGDDKSSSAKSRTIGFELWSDGRPVDPETYIIF